MRMIPSSCFSGYGSCASVVLDRRSWVLGRYFSDHTRGPFTDMSAQNGLEGSTHLRWSWRCAAQHNTLRQPQNLSQGMLQRTTNFPPKLRRHGASSEWYTALLQLPRFLSTPVALKIRKYCSAHRASIVPPLIERCYSGRSNLSPKLRKKTYRLVQGSFIVLSAAVLEVSLHSYISAK